MDKSVLSYWNMVGKVLILNVIISEDGILVFFKVKNKSNLFLKDFFINSIFEYFC